MPGQQISGVTPWRRYPLTYQQSRPAAGADATALVPGGQRWNVLSVQGRLVASAAVANRTPQLVVKQGGNTFLTIPSPVTITAGLTRTIAWWPGAVAANDGNVYQVPIPTLVLDAGDSISTLTGAIDAGDQWDALWLNLLVEDVQEGPTDLVNLLAQLIQGQSQD